MADIVSDFIERLQAVVPEIPAGVLQYLEAEIRHSWGGTEPYVAKRVNRITHENRQERVRAIGAGLRESLPLREVFERAGVSRRTGYRILRQR